MGTPYATPAIHRGPSKIVRIIFLVPFVENMGMCTICGGVTSLDEDLGIMTCDDCGAEV